VTWGRLLRRRTIAHRIARMAGFGCVAILTVWSAILAKEARSVPVLAKVQMIDTGSAEARIVPASMSAVVEVPAEPVVAAEQNAVAVENEPWTQYLEDSNIRWFNGRPVRPARTVTMMVTGYSPDAKSCGGSADGITATLHSVTTNGSALVAADPKMLPYGSMITVPGYDNSKVVPVLDCGGAIKGNRLDVLFTTDAEAMKWGRKTVEVVIWEYADGTPIDNPRALR
jgi:3D (Asp-Asp-Asp) domain-containing protein